MKKHFLILCIAGMMLPGTLFSQAIVNSGFEDSLSNWEPAFRDGGAALLDVTPLDTREGALALKVQVTGVGTSDSAVRIFSAPFALDPGEIYLVRFWARSNHTRGALHMDVLSGGIADGIDFFITNDWYRFQYAFKATDNQAHLAFSFNTYTTYGIDGIELLSGSDEKVDVPMTYMWQNSMKGWGWVSGDNDPSVELPDGRVAWIFNDSWLGNPDPHSNTLDVKGMYSNMIVLQEGAENDSLRTIYGGTMQDPEALLKSATSGTWYWIADGIIEDNKMKVLLQQWEAGDDGWPSFMERAAVAVLSLPELNIENIVELSYYREDIPNCILEGDGDYNYIYTVERITSFEWYTRVARVPKGALESTDEWEFYTDQDTWATGAVTPKRLTTGEPGSVIRLDQGRYAMVIIPQLSNRVELCFADSPEGPWEDRTFVYYVASEPDVYAYLPHIHEETGENGVFTISYSVNTFRGIGHQTIDKGTYIPYYIRVDIQRAAEGEYPPELFPSIYYNGVYRSTSGIVVYEGDNLSLNPQSSVEEGTWSWTGPDDFTLASRRVDIFDIRSEQGGYYTVTFTDTNGSKDSLEMHIIVTEESSSSDPDSMDQSPDAYPNPVSETLFIGGLPESTPFRVEVFSLTGGKIMETTRPEIDMGSVAEGPYIIRIHYMDQLFYKCILKIDSGSSLR
jgi:hypothetical protein